MAGLTIRLRRGEIAAIRDAILLARPSEQTVTWAIAFDQDWRIFTPLVGREDQEIARLFSDALIHQEKKDYGSAIKSLDMVLRAQPDLAEARFLRAVCMRDLAVRSGRIEDALASLTTLRELGKAYPQLAEISYETGVTLRVLGQTDAAIAELTKVVAVRPDFAPAHHALGLAYLSKGDKTRTKDHLNEYLRLSGGQSGQYVQEARGTLDNIDNLLAEPSSGKRESKSYVDGQNRFKCQYPAIWKVLGAREAKDLLPGMKDAQNVAVVFMDPVKSDNNVNVQIMPISADTLTDQDIKDAIPELDTAYKTQFKNFRKIAAGPISVGGICGIRYDFACDRAAVPIRQCVVTLVQNKKAYTITFTSQEGDYEIAWAGHIDGFLRDLIIMP
jgi:tetratricopeptide (TPR) repeat protein